MEKILFANIGWMLHYQGQNASDTISGAGSYRDDDKHEAFNFQNLNGWCYGYVEPVKGRSIELNNIAPTSPFVDRLEDVLVIWTAPRPDSGGTYIVGWYKHAIVYRTFQSIKSKARNNYSYNIQAKFENCFLLESEDRCHLIPRKCDGQKKGLMGQSNVWFANSDLSYVKRIRKEALDFVHAPKPKKVITVGHIKVDAEARKRVEEAAIKSVTKAYENRGYEVVSVEKDNLGWDLEAKCGEIFLRIEVKGLAGEEIAVHITCNEYLKMCAKDNSNYRLCVVINALISPELYVFIFNGHDWVCEADSSIVLDLDLQIAAIGSVK